jgi:hypothetical protein
MNYFEFTYLYLILSSIGFFLIFLRDDYKLIISDIFKLIFRVWYMAIIHFIICFFLLPFTLPFSLVNIIKRIFKK